MSLLGILAVEAWAVSREISAERRQASFALGVQLRPMVEILGLDRGKPSTFGTVHGRISDEPPRINGTRFGIPFSARKVLADRKAA